MCSAKIRRTCSISNVDSRATVRPAISEYPKVDVLVGGQRDRFNDRRGDDGQEKQNKSYQQQDGEWGCRPQHDDRGALM